MQNATTISWTDDGKLLVGDDRSLRLVSPDGSSSTVLLSDPNSWLIDATRCGSHGIAMSWSFHGGDNHAAVWFANLDGSGAQRLTKEGLFNWLPVCSSDGKWVYYTSSEAAAVFRVPSDGGDPQTLAAAKVKRMFAVDSGIGISPDGKKLAFAADIADPNDLHSSTRLVIADVEGNAAPLVLPVNAGITATFQNNLSFTPDGKSVAYVVREKGVDNVFVQPLDGTAGHAITHFPTNRIQKIAFSPDGKSLAVIRSQISADVVLLQEK